jgi:hypothetical protein
LEELFIGHERKLLAICRTLLDLLLGQITHPARYAMVASMLQEHLVATGWLLMELMKTTMPDMLFKIFPC